MQFFNVVFIKDETIYVMFTCRIKHHISSVYPVIPKCHFLSKTPSLLSYTFRFADKMKNFYGNVDVICSYFLGKFSYFSPTFSSRRLLLFSYFFVTFIYYLKKKFLRVCVLSMFMFFYM